jgi:hypothetical protein
MAAGYADTKGFPATGSGVMSDPVIATHCQPGCSQNESGNTVKPTWKLYTQSPESIHAAWYYSLP